MNRRKVLLAGLGSVGWHRPTPRARIISLEEYSCKPSFQSCWTTSPLNPLCNELWKPQHDFGSEKYLIHKTHVE